MLLSSYDQFSFFRYFLKGKGARSFKYAAVSGRWFRQTNAIEQNTDRTIGLRGQKQCL